MEAKPDIKAIADEVIGAIADRRQIPPFTGRQRGLTLTDSYRVTPLVRARFEARGERITGRKIGFTNREMWPVYGVDAPVWGYTTDRTTHELAATPVVEVADFVEPRIEPEIMFGLGARPAPDMDEAALLDCIDWISLGYEIVQSIYPGWKFAAADTVAANGLHGALLVGTRHAITPRKTFWAGELSSFTVELLCNGEPSQPGGGELVLGSPLRALAHLAALTHGDPANPPLAAGDIVSTGTLTLAMPVGAGQSWTTRAAGIPLKDITVKFA